MAAPQVFRILSEFKFEVGGAIASAANLEGAVGKISEAAQDVQFQIAKVGFGFASSLGLVGGGALGLLSNVISSFDSLEKKQIKLGGILFANKSFLSGLNDSNDALRMSETLLGKVSNQAEKFGLDEAALAQFASLGIGVTAKEGISPEKNIEFARNILKASPQLGVNAFEAQGQITRSLLGGASLGDPAFRAVVQETDVFKDFAKKVGGVTKVTKEFNALPTAERFQLLNNAFGQFTQSAALLNAQATTMSSLILRIRQTLFGLNGVFKPLGQTVVPLVKDALAKVLDFMKGPLRTVIRNFSDALKNLVPNLETAAIRLQQLSDAAGNVQKAGFGTLLLGVFQFLGGIGLIGKVLQFVAPVLRGVVQTAGGLAGILLKLRGAITFVASGIEAFLKPFLLLTFVFDILSRALAIARIDDAKRIPVALARISEAFKNIVSALSIVLTPLDNFLNSIASIFSPIFKTSLMFEFLASSLEFVETVIVSVLGALGGALSGLISIADNLLQGNFKKAFDSDEIARVVDFSSGEFFKDVLGRDKFGGDRPTSQPNVNIGKIDIINDFKEKIEPDRVAFTVKDQIMKAALNPTGNRAVNAGVGK